jgi:hypothetical protein
MSVEKNEGNSGSLNKPSFPYHEVRKSTFEDLENENREYSMSLTAAERFAYLLQLNINAYGRSSLVERALGTRIYRP